MPTYFAIGGPDTEVSDAEIRGALDSTFKQLGQREKVLALPPDFTRAHSQAGKITCMVHDHFAQN